MKNRPTGGPITDLFGGVIGWQHSKKPIKLIEAEREGVNAIIEANHYSGTHCNNSFANLVVYYGDHGVTGAVQIGYGIRPQKSEQGLVEFDRMWLSDIMPKYSETIVLSLVHKYLYHKRPDIHTLRSYSDTSVGNHGTIYRAANYVETKRIPADIYVLPSGDRVHPVTMWHRYGTRSKAFLDEKFPGWKKAEGEQIQFEYYLRKRG